MFGSAAVALSLIISAAAPAGVDEALARGQALMGRCQYAEALVLLEPLAAGAGSLAPDKRALLFFELSAAHSQTGGDQAARCAPDVDPV